MTTLSLNSSNPGTATVSTPNPTNVLSGSNATLANLTVTGTVTGTVSGPIVATTATITNATIVNLLASSATVAANATGTQASGTAIVAMNNAVTSAGVAYSVTLPVSVVGMEIDIVCTTGTNTVAVFPNAGGTTTETINALSANAGLTMPALSSATFICVVAGQWWTSPRVPS